jgi:hypothetical protein
MSGKIRMWITDSHTPHMAPTVILVMRKPHLALEKGTVVPKQLIDIITQFVKYINQIKDN